MLTKGESAELLMKINDYVAAESTILSTKPDTERRRDAIDRASKMLERLLEFVEAIGPLPTA